MEIWLLQNYEYIRLPILPSSLEIGNTMQNSTVNISNFGEVNLLGNKGLRTITLSSFFPKKFYSFVQYSDYPTPDKCVNLIKSWMNNPIDVFITSIIKLSMTIESFSYSRQDATGDVTYTLELKEYKKPTVKTYKKIKVEKSNKKIQHPALKRKYKLKMPINYVVQKGDTILSIAQKLTGSASNYRAIANQNNIKNLINLTVGQKLVIKL
ncbi:LysM peptidoglycan-binding domain-containing protein [Anaeromicropila herbilytica]|uniref:Phage-like element PBSX protein XkdP n=1 Tax=Anaeromicropila herbilytica TaxID=2785025 RepID=A0A7R7END6_9FIRM|nr:LysM domain-containing protein [Anaeromicropila herbilytica]BCN32066.1 phage-like element PBSX protein XkdP [Anaeromicropila herbilytica]